MRAHGAGGVVAAGLRVLSLFSGIGGFDLGLERAGMQVVGQVEIDPYCRAVLARHWPDVARYDDVRDVGVGRAKHYVEGQPDDAEVCESVPAWRTGDVDLVCGGFPCQDLSVAGKRAGLDGARSGLWFEFRRILSELRPRWALVENVPGLLSSNRGRDFAVILDGLGECGFGGIAWAVLDSQHFGVAQRRRRVFIVAGPTRRSAEAVLALCESCGGHPAAGRAAGEDIAGETGSGVAKSLRARANASFRDDSDTYVPVLSYALVARNAKGVSLLDGQDTFVVRTAHTSPNGHGVASDAAYTLDGAGGQAVAFAIQERAVSERESGPSGKGWSEELAYTMESRPTPQMVEHTLRAEGFDASEDGTGRGIPLVTHSSVRRLTPVECERLQGFPDGWTHGADGPRYRALGNAATVPVAEWIGRRIMAVEAL